MPSEPIRLLLNGRAESILDVAPTTSLLTWLRSARGLPGTKEGCAEGDCGACTVVIGELIGPENQLSLSSLNACIQFVPALDGKAVFTVEYLRQQAHGALHPVQQAMVDCHASQCGFCTPGFVMSLWGLYNQAQAEDVSNTGVLHDALSGNLCRCTGYRPIIDAGRRMFELPALPLDRDAIREALLALDRSADLEYHHPEGRFHAPRTLDALAGLRAKYPEATLLAGCTDIGLWVNKQFRPIDTLIDLGAVRDLHTLEVSGDTLVIGAAVSLEQAYAALTEHYPTLREIWKRFASLPVRNAGTLGGNIANGSPIGDSMPALIALGAQVQLASVRGTRRLALEDFYLDYMKKDLADDEFVAGVEVPLPSPTRHFRCYKVSKRHDSDISAICGGFGISIADGLISEARVAFGGMAATVRRASHAEQALQGHPWNEDTLTPAMHALAQDYTPLSDMRASAAYRSRVAANLLRRFYLETRPHAPLEASQSNVFEMASGGFAA